MNDYEGITEEGARVRGDEIAPPLVSICCATYNQRDYVAQMLDSLLMQECDFRYEIIVHDDASTDGTTEIIRDYVKRFPGVIRLIAQTINQYSQGVGIYAKLLWPTASGRYIALCEGDDYWSDPLKLQKQVSFLETHSSHSAVHTHCMVLDHDGKTQMTKNMYYCPDDLRFEDLVQLHTVIRTPAFMMRNRAFSHKVFADLSAGLPCGDLPLFIYCSLYGPIRLLQDCTAVYRRNTGVSAGFSDEVRNRYLLATQRFSRRIAQTSQQRNAVVGEYERLYFERAKLALSKRKRFRASFDLLRVVSIRLCRKPVRLHYQLSWMQILHVVKLVFPLRMNKKSFGRSRLILFGTGTGGKNGYEYYKNDFCIIGFCDNNPDKQGQLFCGIPTYAPSELQYLQFDTIIICSMYVSSIRSQLVDKVCISPEKIGVIAEDVRARM